MQRTIYTYLSLVVATLVVALSACTQYADNSRKEFHALLDSASKFKIEGKLDSAMHYVDKAAAVAISDYQKTCVRERKAYMLYYAGDKVKSRALLRDVLDFFDRDKSGENDMLLKLRALDLLAKIEQENGNVKEALRLYQRSSNIAKELGERKLYIQAQIYVHGQEYKAGRYAEAVEGLQLLLEYCENEGIDGSYRFRILECLYKVYFALGDVSTARHYISSMESMMEPGDVQQACTYNVSLYYLSDSIRNTALQRQCIDMLSGCVADSILPHKSKVEALQVLSLYNIKQENFDAAGSYLKQLHELELSVPKEQRYLKSEMLLARYLIASSQLDSARAFLNRVDEAYYKETDVMQYSLYLACKSWFAYASEDYKSSFEIYKKRLHMMDSLKQESISHNLAYKTLRHKRDATIISQKLQIQHQLSQINDIRVVRRVWIAVGIIAALFIVLTFVVIRTLRTKRHSAQVKLVNLNLEREVKYQTKVLEKIEVELRRKNKQLHEQMEYASRIQYSMLPDSSTISSEMFSQVFVIYRPCAMISGDFYWTAQCGHKKCICVGDATGHGIPGAFIAMVSSTILNDIALSMENPSAVSLVSELDNNIRTILQTNDTTHGNDSVDASMICIDEETKKITLSLARHNAYLIKVNGDVQRLAGVKRSIGDIDPEFMKRPFEEITLETSPGDCLYLMSDGYESQLGGPNGKKLKRNNMIELLAKYREYSMPDQRQCLIGYLDDWMGDNEQTDDILMVGMRIA